MNVVRCKNGHFFDGDSYSTCPHCGAEAITNASSVSAKQEKKSSWGWGSKEKNVNSQYAPKPSPVIPHGNFGDGNTPTDAMGISKTEETPEPLLKKNPTLDFWQTSSHPEKQTSEQKVKEEEFGTRENNEANEKEEVNVLNDGQSTLKELKRQQEESKAYETPSSLREAVKKASATNEGKTMSYFSSATNPSSATTQSVRVSEPVVGWLVCVGGCHFGECFNIYAGKNSIGRSEENRMVIPKDNSISRIKHALIVYEPKKRNFYLQPGDSSGLTYLNDDYITDSQKLEARDMIELGDSKFIFVPLCGEDFSWEDHMPKGE